MPYLADVPTGLLDDAADLLEGGACALGCADHGDVAGEDRWVWEAERKRAPKHEALEGSELGSEGLG